VAIELTFPNGCALVAGGTGTVGQGVVRRFAASGTPTVFTYFSRKDEAEALQDELRAKGSDVTAVRMDFGDQASIDGVLQDAVAKHGRLHSVACAAGMKVWFNNMAEFTAEEVSRFIEGDAIAYFRLFQRAIPHLRKGGGGSITTCTTIAFRRYVKYDGLSPFSKGAVEALVRQLAAEEGPNGIRVNAIPIGWITEFEPKDLYARLSQAEGDNSRMLMELMQQLEALLRLGRPGRGEECGDLFVFLASDQARYITGQSVAIDGGVTL
jgi:3-oxoacyl-[acyl-carrier protein] reductase